MPFITNATVSIRHADGTDGPQHIRVSLRPPSLRQKEQLTSLGGQVISSVCFDPNLDIRPAGDRMTIESLDSFLTLSAVKPYELLNVARHGSPILALATITADVRGFIT